MPKFETLSQNVNYDREKQLSMQELFSALRYSISAEYEAIQIYEQLAARSNNPNVTKVLLNIAREEKVHAGELLSLLFSLDQDSKDTFKEGSEEVAAIIASNKTK